MGRAGAFLAEMGGKLREGIGGGGRLPGGDDCDDDESCFVRTGGGSRG